MKYKYEICCNIYFAYTLIICFFFSFLKGTFFDKESLLDFAEIGCILEYDLFGIETSHYQLKESIDMPSDAQRIQVIKSLVDEGLEDRIVIAHDIHTKHRLVCIILIYISIFIYLFDFFRLISLLESSYYISY